MSAETQVTIVIEFEERFLDVTSEHNIDVASALCMAF